MKIADITFGMPRNKAALNPAGVAPEGQPTTLSSSLSAAGNAMHIVPDFCATGGDDFTDEAPAFLLHHFVDGRLNTHYCRVPGEFAERGPFSFSHPPKLG